MISDTITLWQPSPLEDSPAVRAPTALFVSLAAIGVGVDYFILGD